MADLSNSIFEEYARRLGELPFDKKFHFASRLHLWHQDPITSKLLTDFKIEFTGNDNPEQVLQKLVDEAKASPSHGSKNASELREPYFAKYPTLKTLVMVLFRITFLKNIYGLDCRSFLYTVASKEELDKLCSDLLQDTEAMAILSTHAVNFIYLYQRVISERGEVPVETMFEIAKYYKRDDNIHLQLFIYLYTHCIIGETQFYYRHIPEADKPLYVKMVQELENLIDERFYDINLDNKCEFLVCAKIVGYKTHLEPRIFAEAEQSVSENGKFLVDRHNNNPQTDNITLDKSEHRNVLYIMANRDFTPLA